MELIELKQEQRRLSSRIELRDTLSSFKTIGAAECFHIGNELLAVVVVCDANSFEVIEKQTYTLHDPLPYRLGFQAYREMPAIIEVFNKLEHEPDLLLIKGTGILHPRRFGIASHIGLILNIPTIGILQKLSSGEVKEGKIWNQDEICGFEITTREHANPIYAIPGNLVTLGTVLRTVSKLIVPPHKLPEPMHLVHKIGKRKVKMMKNSDEY